MGLEFTPIEQIGYQPFRMLLEGTLGDHLWYERIRQSGGCFQVGCPFACCEETCTTEGYDWSGWCEGYTSETAAEHCFERYLEYGASECRMFQLWKAGKVDG